MRSFNVLGGLLILACSFAGCNQQSDITESTATSVAFDGKPDQRFVGTWKTADKQSTYVFDKDGKYHLRANVKTRYGNFETKVDARWCLNKANDRMLLEDASKNVVPYTYKLEGNKLTLALTGSLKNETVMFKQLS